MHSDLPGVYNLRIGSSCQVSVKCFCCRNLLSSLESASMHCLKPSLGGSTQRLSSTFLACKSRHTQHLEAKRYNEFCSSERCQLSTGQLSMQVTVKPSYFDCIRCCYRCCHFIEPRYETAVTKSIWHVGSFGFSEFLSDSGGSVRELDNG